MTSCAGHVFDTCTLSVAFNKLLQEAAISARAMEAAILLPAIVSPNMSERNSVTLKEIMVSFTDTMGN